MKKIKVSEAQGPVLDWMVAKAEGYLDSMLNVKTGVVFGLVGQLEFSTDWAQGGPIIEEEQLCVGFQHQLSSMYVPTIDPDVLCWARTTPGGFLKYGPTPLIAAMRCFCASKLGDEVDVPEELV